MPFSGISVAEITQQWPHPCGAPVSAWVEAKTPGHFTLQNLGGDSKAPLVRISVYGFGENKHSDLSTEGTGKYLRAEEVLLPSS